MNKQWVLPICCIFVLGFSQVRSFAQPPVDVDRSNAQISGAELWNLTEGKLFNGQVHKISVRMNQAAWNRLHEDEKNNGCRDTGTAKWAHVRDFTFNGNAVKDVAIKIRGGNSRCLPQLQFSISFNRTKDVYTRQDTGNWIAVEYSESTREAIEDRTLHGLEELNLSGSFSDAGQEDDNGNDRLAREFVAAWAAAKAEEVVKTTLRGPPVYRTAYALVEFQFCTDDADNVCNNRFARAYLIEEPLDKGFFKMRYDDDKPTVFSMAHGCALRIDRGSKGFTYPCVEPEYLDGKKMDEADAAAQLKALAHITGAAGLKTRMDAADTAPELGEVLDLDSIMNYAAFATTAGHWDSAYGNFNNDVLYFHAPSGKWKLIARDVNDTFDSDSRGGPPCSYSYAEIAQAPRILFDKLFGIPKLDAQFRKHLGDYLTALYGRNGSDSPLKNKIMEVSDRYIMKTDGELPDSEPQNTQPAQKAQKMLDYATQRLRILRNQPRPAQAMGPTGAADRIRWGVWR